MPDSDAANAKFGLDITFEAGRLSGAAEACLALESLVGRILDRGEVDAAQHTIREAIRPKAIALPVGPRPESGR